MCRHLFVNDFPQLRRFVCPVFDNQLAMKFGHLRISSPKKLKCSRYLLTIIPMENQVKSAFRVQSHVYCEIVAVIVPDHTVNVEIPSLCIVNSVDKIHIPHSAPKICSEVQLELIRRSLS